MNRHSLLEIYYNSSIQQKMLLQNFIRCTKFQKKT